MSVLLVVAQGPLRPAEAADVQSQVQRKANAGCPAVVLSSLPGAPKSNVALPAVRSTTRNVAHTTPVAESTEPPEPAAAAVSEPAAQADPSPFVLAPLAGNRKPAAALPAPTVERSPQMAIEIQPGRVRTDVKSEPALLPGAITQGTLAVAPTSSQTPRLFSVDAGQPLIVKSLMERSLLATSGPAEMPPPAAQQTRSEGAAAARRESEVIVSLIPQAEGQQKAACVQPVKAEVAPEAMVANSHLLHAVQQAPPSLSEPGASPPPMEEGTLVPGPGGYGQLIEEPAAFNYGAYPPACPPPCPLGCDQNAWAIPWQVFAHGEYIGPARLPHLMEYRLRVDDIIEFVYRLTGEKSAAPYRINIGDTLKVESLTAENLDREVLVQPDGTISLRQLGQVPAAGRTIDELRQELDELYREFVQNPTITITPVTLNTTLEELRATVDARSGSGGQSRTVRVTPEGTVQLPAIGSVPAHGLTLDELGHEIELRYANIVDGLEVTPILSQRAPRYVYVVGEVLAPGRYNLEGPTSLMQAIALAGGWNVGGNLRQVIIFRRDENWRLLACKINIRAPLYGNEYCPGGDMWLRDSDIVVVPKSPILVADDFIELVFTRGIYGVIPFGANLSFVRSLSSMGGIVTIPATAP